MGETSRQRPPFLRQRRSCWRPSPPPTLSLPLPKAPTLLSQGVGTSLPSHMRGSRLAQDPAPSAPSTSSRTAWQNTMRR